MNDIKYIEDIVKLLIRSAYLSFVKYWPNFIGKHKNKQETLIYITNDRPRIPPIGSIQRFLSRLYLFRVIYSVIDMSIVSLTKLNYR